MNMEKYPFLREKKSAFTVIFFIFLTLLTLSALYVKYSGEGFSFTGRKGKLPAFDPVKVHRIELSWKENKVTLLLQKDNLWHLAERNMVLASASRVGDLLHQFSTVRILKELDSPSYDVLKQLNLLEKEDKKNSVQPGILAVLKDKEGKELFRMILGRGHYPPVSTDSPGTVTAKGRYILVNDRIFLAARLFENCIPLPQFYVEPLAIRNMNTALLVMRSALSAQGGKNGKDQVNAPVWAAVRKRTNLPFSLIFPAKTFLDMQKFTHLSETFAKQLTLDVLPGLDPEKIPLTSSYTIQLADGFSYTLGMAKRGREDLLMPKVMFDEKKIRRLSGESPQRYQARLSGAMLRFESEKRYYNGKVFRMVPGVAEKLAAAPFAEKKKSMQERKRKNTYRPAKTGKGTPLPAAGKRK